jgi:hypothetical protein
MFAGTCQGISTWVHGNNKAMILVTTRKEPQLQSWLLFATVAPKCSNGNAQLSQMAG